ncbi:DMT family transporter [Streptomyces sp. NEAU-W12]|uniref:DMT family transporter n=1 Tax=Streptomyces sp. NEAU-W12 TaxID=2994668 RepID=UPI00224B9E42|nr:DMT family transporter [Streptomyces sp. NEAU-W12]MCX2928059.1 DMT family transporter [Streptomyces sp. NEAU-W12]
MNIVVAVSSALMAAVCFGIGSVLQHEAARQVSMRKSMRLRLLLDLGRRPRWLVGLGLSVSSFAFLGLALAFGPLVLVLPLAATDLLFALPFLALRRGEPLTGWEKTGIVCTAGGVAVFLTVLPLSPGTTAPAVHDWVPAFAAVVGVVALLAPVGAWHPGRLRTAAYAICAALMLALLDGLAKSTASRFRTDGLDVIVHWEPYALMVVGVTSLVLSQSAFQAGSLAVSLPIIDTLEPIGAVTIGIVVFGEQLALTGWALTVQMLGAAAAVTGIVLLRRSPLAAE